MQSINEIDDLSPEKALKELAKAPESTFSDSVALENADFSISLKVADAKFVVDWDIKKKDWDWVGLYAHTKDHEFEYLKWTWAVFHKDTQWRTNMKVKNGIVARYYRYNTQSKRYDLLAESEPYNLN